MTSARRGNAKEFTIANEFATAQVAASGPESEGLLIVDPTSGLTTVLDPLELLALVHARHAHLRPLLGNMAEGPVDELVC